MAPTRLPVADRCGAVEYVDRVLGQKPTGQLLASRVARATSMIERIARSATPLSECTCGGHVVRSMVSLSRYSVNSFERNSPALSICSWPTTLIGSARPTLTSAFSFATKARIFAGASLLVLRKYTCLYLE